MSLTLPEQTQEIPACFYKNTQWQTITNCGSLTLPENWPHIHCMTTENNEPVNNIFAEKQQRLLTESLYNAWYGSDRSFVALSKIGLIYAPNKPPIVPDMLLSLDVKMPHDIWRKQNRSYFVPQYGKPPEVAIEIVSNQKGEEAGNNFQKYAQAKVRYYVIFDPQNALKEKVLRIYELHNTNYVEKNIDRGGNFCTQKFLPRWLFGVKLGLTLWEGWYEDKHDVWLRWYGEDDKLILTGKETTKEQRLAREKESLAKQKLQQQIEYEHSTSLQFQRQAQQEQQRAECLAKKLREMGIDPDEF
ncbi:Uma2 family endonuclease [Candidatus Parabeggiatoa sp. HSG14]|uniref:Uma2 family endonuclease n=1 Tax=Candidatus Parabeggiatoa sp. HSG14 TaxID=3055593 RepID=UPI0025A806E4|nr:Uma2 family endonuclease [Thiotrichales bacterium HSG14]